MGPFPKHKLFLRPPTTLLHFSYKLNDPVLGVHLSRSAIGTWPLVPRRTKRDKRLNNRPRNQSRPTTVGKTVGKNLLVYIYIYTYNSNTDKNKRIAQAFRVLFIRGSESSIIRQIGWRSYRHETLPFLVRDNCTLPHFRVAILFYPIFQRPRRYLFFFFFSSTVIPKHRPAIRWNPGYREKKLISFNKLKNGTFRRKITFRRSCSISSGFRNALTGPIDVYNKHRPSASDFLSRN